MIELRPSSGKFLLFFGGVVLLCLGIGLGAFLFSPGPDRSVGAGESAPAENKIAGAISETFGEVFGISKKRSPILEIDLSKDKPQPEAQSKQNIAVSTSAAGTTSLPPRPAAPEKETKTGNSGDGGQPQKAAARAAAPQAADCEFDSPGAPGYAVLLNEIAWMGTEASANDEWLELKNGSGSAIDLSGWQILSKDERIKFRLPEAILKPGEFFLLERSDDESLPDIKADAIYTGLLPNGGSWLRLFDKNCNLVDEINASGGWGSFGGDRVKRMTLERNSGDLGWHTSSVVGGTPRAPNSQPAPVEESAQTSSQISSQTPALPPPASQSSPPGNTGCIDINSAPKSELMKITQIGEARADQIIKLREERPFSSLDDLARVDGISAGGSRLNAIKNEGLACVK